MNYLKGSDKVSGSENGLQSKKQIDWNDYTYPPCPCIKMFHYLPEQTPQRYQRKVMLLKINHIAIIVALCLNVLTNIVGAAQGLQMGGVRIGISIFVLLIWIPISIYLFIRPYQVMLGETGSVLIFYALSAIAFVWFFIWSIADFADANGFVMIGKHFNQNRVGAGILSIITSVLMMLISLLAVINAVFFYKRE